jgi:hypothetical protein
MLSRPTALFAALACALSLCLLPGCEDTSSPWEPAPPLVIDSPEAVITTLARAYSKKDTGLIATLLASEPGVECRFLPCGVSDPHEGSIIDPRLPPPPIPPTEWTPQTIVVSVVQLEAFGERPDLYSVDGGLDGKLDPRRWHAVDARYSGTVLLRLADLDYKIEGEANFVVIQDLTKHPGDSGTFFLYLWEEICAAAMHLEKS